MKLFLLAFIVGICVVFSVPKSFSADVIKQEAKEKLEKKTN
ncbi:hypothetical protein [Commensalibacter papalotli (ex Botero et al. 2024)]|nr:hypothetical protein [Commensalibacter papalotli (ex Botero et al. 2024)]CAI3934383.1 unnamed protein product [Commensalibacter papalotli (ex Botero et al. 2024)]